ncbi:MAG: hypothetical protein ACRC5A_02135 [Enterobacteriaceae bacterium]
MLWKNSVLFLGLCLTGQGLGVAKTPPALPADLQEIGLYISIPYQQAREKLLNHHWDIDISEVDDINIHHRYSEVSCSKGRNALCYTAYHRGEMRYGLVWRSSKRGLVVTGIY